MTLTWLHLSNKALDRSTGEQADLANECALRAKALIPECTNQLARVSRKCDSQAKEMSDALKIQKEQIEHGHVLAEQRGTELAEGKYEVHKPSNFTMGEEVELKEARMRIDSFLEEGHRNPDQYQVTLGAAGHRLQKVCAQDETGKAEAVVDLSEAKHQSRKASE